MFSSPNNYNISRFFTCNLFNVQNFKKAALLPAHSNSKSVSKIPINHNKKFGTKVVTNLTGTGKGVAKGKKAFTYAYRPDLVTAATARYQKLKKVSDIRNGKGKAARPATKRGSRQ